VRTTPFWDGARAGSLVLQCDAQSGRFQHPPRPVALGSGRRDVDWRAVSGNGIVYAFTVLRAAGPGLRSRLPLPVVIVELDEGVRIVANLLDAPGDVAIGARVTLAWDRLDDDVPYPAFRLTPAR
jgi:uncharacterized OB-fold protein